MFIVIKKSGIISFAVCLFVSAFIFFYLNRAESVFVETSPSFSGSIVLDAGHGDIDGGAVGKNGTVEKDINLAVCKKTKAYLEKCGMSVIVTRDDDLSLTDKNGKSTRQIKRDDLSFRRKMRDGSGAEIFVSIHMNKFPDEKYSGAQVFYASSPEKSKILGETIQKNLIDILDKENTRAAKRAENSIYILKDSPIPAVIVECGFLSNEKEEALLKTESYQNKIAWAIFSGIKEYMKTN